MRDRVTRTVQRRTFQRTTVTTAIINFIRQAIVREAASLQSGSFPGHEEDSGAASVHPVRHLRLSVLAAVGLHLPRGCLA